MMVDPGVSLPHSPIKYEISVKCIGYRTENDEHRIPPPLWKVLMYTHSSEPVRPQNSHILGFDSIHS